MLLVDSGWIMTLKSTMQSNSTCLSGASHSRGRPTLGGVPLSGASHSLTVATVICVATLKAGVIAKLLSGVSPDPTNDGATIAQALVG